MTWKSGSAQLICHAGPEPKKLRCRFHRSFLPSFCRDLYSMAVKWGGSRPTPADQNSVQQGCVQTRVSADFQRGGGSFSAVQKCTCEKGIAMTRCTIAFGSPFSGLGQFSVLTRGVARGRALPRAVIWRAFSPSRNSAPVPYFDMALNDFPCHQEAAVVSCRE